MDRETQTELGDEEKELPEGTGMEHGNLEMKKQGEDKVEEEHGYKEMNPKKEDTTNADQKKPVTHMLLYRNYEMTFNFEPDTKILPDHPHHIIERKFPSVPVYPPYWLHTTINGHHVKFILDSTYPHNTMDKVTAERIGVTKYLISKKFTVVSLRHPTQSTVVWKAYLNIKIHLETGISFYLDMWVSDSVDCMCRIGMGSLNRLQAVQYFHPTHPRIFFRAKMLYLPRVNFDFGEVLALTSR